MKVCDARCLFVTMLLLIVITKTVSAQEEPLCVENSPERRGEIGCSIVENKPLPAESQGAVILAH